MRTEIPIFFSTDDHYMPYLDVAVASLIANASKDYTYRIIVLNTGLQPENIAKVKLNERDGFVIDFVDISENVKHIKSCFKNVYHFSVASYYRLFIASLFPQYDKIVYLDCDLVVLGDIAELYNTELGVNILGAVADQFVCNTKEFRRYAQKALGVDPDRYFNTGVMLISLEQFRKNNIENKFIQLITQYDFDLLDLRKIDGAAVDSGGRTGLEAPQRKPQFAQIIGQAQGRVHPVRAGGLHTFTDDNGGIQERAGTDNNGLCGILRTQLGAHAGDSTVIRHDIHDLCLL